MHKIKRKAARIEDMDLAEGLVYVYDKLMEPEESDRPEMIRFHAWAYKHIAEQAAVAEATGEDRRAASARIFGTIRQGLQLRETVDDFLAEHIDAFGELADRAALSGNTDAVPVLMQEELSRCLEMADRAHEAGNGSEWACWRALAEEYGDMLFSAMEPEFMVQA